jgi:hypothetical protein
MPSAAQWVSIERLHGWDKNPRKNDQSVKTVAASIYRFGFGAPITANKKNGEIVAGHTRLKAIRFLQKNEPRLDGDNRVIGWGRRKANNPYHVVDHYGPDGEPVLAPGPDMVPVRPMGFKSEKEAHSYNLVDNKSGEESSWDLDGLAGLMDDLDLDDLGWSEEDLAELQDLSDVDGSQGDVEEDEAPEVEQGPPDSVVGEVYELGPHRLVCGDSTDPEIVALLFDGQSRAWALHSDPPYGMGKESEGVLNDNLYNDKLDAFQMAWWAAWRPHIVDNGSAYIWGNAPDLWRLWWRHLETSERLTLKNEIVWNKGSGMGMASSAHRMFATATERCLFFMFGAQEFGNQNKDDYWEGWEPVRSYLDGEREKMGWSKKDVNEMTGTHMAGHWFSKSQWVMPSREHYETMQGEAEGRAFLRPYDTEKEHGLLSEFSGIRDEFMAGRCFFDGSWDAMTDVWEFPRVIGEERHEHATPKPVKMVARAVRSSCPEDGIVAEPFGGSGSTLMACAQTSRVCLMAELSERYCDVIRRRWTRWAREHGADPGPGALDG